jgi:release factor glutamine methyltransferase
MAFGGLSITWQGEVLEPRPWTATQGAWAARIADRHPAPILEVFAGVGHIGLLAAARSGRPLVQIEADPLACRLARENAMRAGISDRVEIRCCPIEEALSPGERFGVVIADPPYLPSAEVCRYPGDPTHAIDGGDDGLDLAQSCLLCLQEVTIDSDAILMQLRGPDQVSRLAAELDPCLRVGEVYAPRADRAIALLERAARAHTQPDASPDARLDWQNAPMAG